MIDVQLISLLVLGSASLAAASFWSTALLRPVVVRFGIVGSSRRVPLWGGLGFMVLIALLALFFLGESQHQLTALLLGFMALIVFGLLDDVVGLLPMPQLIFQGIIALFIIVGVALPEGELVGSLPLASFITAGDFVYVPSAALANALVGIIFFVASLNAVNWIDGIDGLASALGTALLGIVGFLALFLGVIYPGIFFVFAAAALAGFFVLNKPPARMYMGTAGSMGIGFVAAAVPLMYPSLMPVMLGVLALPFGDALFVIIKRLAAGRSPMRGDRRHLHYILLDAGWREKYIIMLYVLITLAAGGAVYLGGSSIYAGGAGVMAGMALSMILNAFFSPLGSYRADLTSLAKRSTM